MQIPSSNDFYEILGVSVDSTNQEIEKNYKQLCRKFHPDLQKEEDKAKSQKYTMKLNEAYETLKNKELRFKYDISKGYKQNPETSHFFDFGSSDIFNQEEDLNLYLSTDVDLLSAFNGAVKNLSFYKKIDCELCVGVGAELTKNKCKKCNGTGVLGNQIFGLPIFRVACNKCKGTGKDLILCNSCKGAGVKNTSSTISFNIPKGVRSNEKIRIRREGNRVKGKIGDLILTITITHNVNFYFDSANCLCKDYTISLKKAVLRSAIDIETLDGIVTIHLPEKLTSNTILNIKSAGYWKNNTRDILKVKINITIPYIKDADQLKGIDF